MYIVVFFYICMYLLGFMQFEFSSELADGVAA